MQEQLTMNRPKGHHLTLKERGNIEAYFNHDRYSRRKIAELIGVSAQTINNEIKRGLVTNKQLVNGKEKFYEVYVAELAEQRYHEKRKACHRPCKFHQVLAFLAFFVEHFKTDSWAPVVAVGRPKALGLFRSDEMVCTKTLYKYIDDQLLEVCNLDLAEYGTIFKSVTADNGPEFATLSQVMALVAPVYFTHPYTSSERGTNEVHNRMVRRDFPKGESLDAVSPADVARTADKLNNMPRRQLDYRSPAECFAAACG